jgi:hypothetical protein
LHIKNGPSKYDLMIALFEGREVAFVLEYGLFARLQVVGLERTPSGENWIITGKGGLPRREFVGIVWDTNKYVTAKVNFNTKYRNGQIELELPKPRSMRMNKVEAGDFDANGNLILGKPESCTASIAVWQYHAVTPDGEVFTEFTNANSLAVTRL